MILKRKKWIAYLLLFVILYLYHLVVTILPGDDTIFSKASDKYSLIEWLSHRYNGWSGRLFPDAMVYILLDKWVWIWHFINPLMLLLLTFSMVRILKKRVFPREQVIALLILGYLAQNVLSAGVFWITGSINYLWPIALGLFSMIPFADAVFRNDINMNSWKFALHLLSGVIASIGNEQTALCISSFALLSLFHIMIKRDKPDIKLIIFTLLILIGTCIQVFAPGNEVRYLKNTDYWYPGFDLLSFKDHLYIGTIWAYEKLFRDMRYLLLLLSAVVLFSQFNQKKSRQPWILILLTLQFFITVGFHIMSEKLNYIYDFAAIKDYPFTDSLFSIWKMPLDFVFALFPYLFWTFYSFLLMVILLKNSKHKFFVVFSLLATISTLIVMFFSPTIFGSGNRVLTVASVLLGLLVLDVIVENKAFNLKLTISIIGGFSLLNLSIMFIKWYFNGFTSFL